MLEMDKQSCSLSVESGSNIGRLHILNGKLIDAKCDDQVGTDAAYNIFGWQDANVEIDTYRNNRPHRINQSLTAILLDASRIDDETKSPTAEGVPEELAAIAAELAELTEVEPATQNLVPKEGQMNLQQTIRDFQEDVPEFVSTDIVNIDSGLSIGGGSVDSEFDGSVAAASYAEVVKSNRRALDLLGLGAESAEDILITTEKIYVLIRMLGPEYYHVLAVGKKGNLGLARAIMKKHGKKLLGAVSDLS